MLTKLLHPSNACASIVLTVSGSVMARISCLPSKAYSGIVQPKCDKSLEESVTSAVTTHPALISGGKKLQPSKTLVPKCFKVEAGVLKVGGNVTLVRLVQCLNAFLLIS